MTLRNISVLQVKLLLCLAANILNYIFWIITAIHFKHFLGVCEIFQWEKVFLPWAFNSSDILVPKFSNFYFTINSENLRFNPHLLSKNLHLVSQLMFTNYNILFHIYCQPPVTYCCVRQHNVNYYKLLIVKSNYKT